MPYVLKSVKWCERSKVREMMSLLQSWPLVEPEVAITLLDYAYPDMQVRSYAIRCLESMSDETLLLYLLQIVQAIKYESYLMNDLTRFLLTRALRNRLVGHHLFWLLRSEMHDQSIPVASVVFGLILEAYCYGAKDHMKALTKQMSAMNRLAETSDYLKDEIARLKASRDKQKVLFTDTIEDRGFLDSLSGIYSPLDARLKLGRLKTDKCKLMDSKMKPMWLVFSNEDIGAEDTHLIFKNGDGTCLNNKLVLSHTNCNQHLHCHINTVINTDWF